MSLPNVLSAVVQLVLLGSHLMVNGFMPSVLRLFFLFYFCKYPCHTSILKFASYVLTSWHVQYLQWLLESTFRRGQINTIEGMVCALVEQMILTFGTPTTYLLLVHLKN